MLAACSATERGLAIRALAPDFRRFPVDALERRDAFLVSEADAVVEWDGRNPDGRRVLALVERKEILVHVIGRPPRVRWRRRTDPEPEPLRPKGMLPD
jgi:hypothetical protein